MKAYSSVQYGAGPDDHFELNSDLLFSTSPTYPDLPLETIQLTSCCFPTVNHSCTPNVFFDLTERPSRPSPKSPADFPSSWKLKTLSKGIKKGETLTFFYPSTEWDMGAPFDCLCGSDVSTRIVTSRERNSRTHSCRNFGNVCRPASAKSEVPNIYRKTYWTNRSLSTNIFGNKSPEPDYIAL